MELEDVEAESTSLICFRFVACMPRVSDSECTCGYRMGHMDVAVGKQYTESGGWVGFVLLARVVSESGL